MTTSFTETPDPALDESCYSTPVNSLESIPLSVEFEVEHNPNYSTSDYQLGDYRPEESDSSDDDTGLLQQTISIINSFINDRKLKTLISIMPFINWSSSDPIVVDSETNDTESEHFIHWDIDYEGNSEDDLPTTEEPAGVNFIIESNDAGSSYCEVDTQSRYTVVVWSYEEDQCPCLTDNAIPVTTTVTPTSLTYPFENID